jgi:glutathione S-transferase
MKLAYSPASPYVRKVTACAIKRGIDKQIERMKISTTDPELLKYNALSKVPTLITDDGAYLFDSPVICEYLDSIGSAPKLFPPPGPARWKALTQEALADGILVTDLQGRIQAFNRRFAALWSLQAVRTRTWRDWAVAVFFLVACVVIKIPGKVWIATLIPGIVMALLPRHGLRIVELPDAVSGFENQDRSRLCCQDQR